MPTQTRALTTQTRDRKAIEKADAEVIAKFLAGGLIPMDKLVETGVMPAKPKALTPEDVAGQYYIWDLATLRMEAFNHPQGGMMEGIRVEVINPNTGVRADFMSGSAGLVSQVNNQILAALNDLPSMMLPVLITGTPNKTDPERTIWKME